MDTAKAQEILDKVIAQVFGYQNPLSLEDFKRKYAFDVRLPIQVNDNTTGEETWVQSTNPTKFITMTNTLQQNNVTSGEDFLNKNDWMLKKRPVNGIEDVLKAWELINYTTSERNLDSLNFAESDNIIRSENIFHSLDIIDSKNLVFSDGAIGCEYGVAIQRSNVITYSARVEDSTTCSNSFSVSWSGNINNSMFIHDSYDLYECIFCSHIKSKKFCIANMQFEEAEYYKLKEEITRWVLLGE